MRNTGSLVTQLEATNIRDRVKVDEPMLGTKEGRKEDRMRHDRKVVTPVDPARDRRKLEAAT